MLFTSVSFIWFFLPAVLLSHTLFRGRMRNYALLAASLLFYGWGGPKHLFLMLGSMTANWLIGLAIDRTSGKSKKLWLSAGVCFNLLLLGYFKYFNLLIKLLRSGTSLALEHFAEVALPIGISFYTFQCISYTVDVYRGQVSAQKNPISFGAYVSLFPQLIAGPIVRYVDISKELEHRKTNWDDISQGLFLFLVGLSKKVLLANPFGQLTEIFRGSGEKSLLFYWLYALGFTLHIYFDFSGYSDMAVGLGRIFGFHFPRNFNYPYIAGSITEFWRRWHMTLSQWFRDYVYIPLGGNRVTRLRWVRNILTVWILTGLWHGASWNFVVWGLFFAILLLVEKWIPGFQQLPSVLRHGYVLIAVIISFVIFNAPNLAQAWQDLKGMFGGLPIPLTSKESLYYLRSYGFLFLVGILGTTPMIRKLALSLSKKSWGVVLRPVLAAAFLLACTAYLVDGSFNPFLYFRF